MLSLPMPRPVPANAKAMQIAGIDNGKYSISGGKVIQDTEGRPTDIRLLTLYKMIIILIVKW
jgi:hypothetical protein